MAPRAAGRGSCRIPLRRPAPGPAAHMTTLLTGGTGFLGAAMLAPLAEQDEVVAIHRATTPTADAAGVRWVEQDLAAPLRDRLPERLDAVVHLAQSRLYRDFPNAALDIFELNAGATMRL